MAAITISVQSLLNTAVYNSYSVDTTDTVSTVKSTINATARWDSNWYNLVYNNAALTNGSATLASYGINSNVTLRTANVIDRLATKELKQKAKLNLSELDRAAAGNPRSSYNINELPTQYSGNNIVDNPQPDGLTLGRPWVADDIVTTNLVLNLDPDNATSYPGSGATWYDIAGAAQNITLYASPTYTSGTPSYFTFNGTTQYGLSAATGIVNSTAYTKSAYFYLNGYQDNNIFSGDGHFIYMGPQASIDKKIYCGHSDWGSFTAYPSTGTINLNTWYNVTLTFSTTNGMTLYINGVQDSTYTVLKTAHPGTGSASLAAYVSGNLLNGRIGKVLCYRSELTAAQVSQNFNATKAAYGL
jgi:hypothetical protein